MRPVRRGGGAGAGAGRGPRHSRSAVVDRAVLVRRIQSADLDVFDPEAAVAHLRENFSDYSRIKLLPFSHCVRDALQSILLHGDDGAGDGKIRPAFSPRAPRQKAGGDADERRLLQKESEYLRLNRFRGEATASPASSSPDDSTSTSEDTAAAANDAKYEQEPDITKSMLRRRYVKHAGQAVGREEADNMEIETVTEKPKAVMVAGGDCTPQATAAARGSGRSGWKDDAGKQNKGPMFRDLGGMQSVLDELMMEVIVPLCHPQIPRWLGVRPIAGILLHGPPGCGKTMLARAIANETGLPFYPISATEVVSGVSGDSEQRIRDLFKKAYRTAPSIVFIDEIDAIASKRDNLQREMERRIVTQLMTCMDESHQSMAMGDVNAVSELESSKKPGFVLVIGATNRPDAVDQALRRPGRFDHEITLGLPSEKSRLEILSVLMQKVKLEGGEANLFKLARLTPGFAGADLKALVDKAGNLAMRRIINIRRNELPTGAIQSTDDWWKKPWDDEEVERLRITITDFEQAAKIVQPSSRREGFSSIPNVKWEDVGGLCSLRKEFERRIIQCIKNPEVYEELGLKLDAGLLLFGPPGCGKTLIAMAVANESGANFIHIKGPELLNKYVGESELAVRTLFARARACSPCILFFDEVDALTPQRGNDKVVDRLLNQLLIELDGSNVQRHGVYVIGATNRPDVLDPAILRPGRFAKKLYVPLPGPDDRGSILKALARNTPIAADVDLDAIGCSVACNNFSGADLAELIKEAAMAVLEEISFFTEQGKSQMERRVINQSHLKQAMKKISPSVSDEQLEYYNGMLDQLLQ